MSPNEQLETLAAHTLTWAGMAAPDIFVLADVLGLSWALGGWGFDGRTIYIGPSATERERNEYVARCCARVVLRRQHLRETDQSIDGLARALLHSPAQRERRQRRQSVAV